MRRNDKSWVELDQPMEPFLPDESTESGATLAVELRTRLVRLEQQVMAQYTSMAAYATIAKQDVASAKAECRSDLDRSQATLIGLLEKLRKEINSRLDSVESRGSGDVASGNEGSRLKRLEDDLASATKALHRCLRENEELRAQVAELVEHRMQQQGWLVSSGTTEALSLH